MAEREATESKIREKYFFSDQQDALLDGHVMLYDFSLGKNMMLSQMEHLWFQYNLFLDIIYFKNNTLEISK